MGDRCYLTHGNGTKRTGKLTSSYKCLAGGSRVDLEEDVEKNVSNQNRTNTEIFRCDHATLNAQGGQKKGHIWLLLRIENRCYIA